MDEEPLTDFTTRKTEAVQRSGSIAENSPIEQLSPSQREMVDEFIQEYQSLISTDEEEKFYWDERDYDSNDAEKRAQLFEELKSQATRNEDGELVVEVDDATFAMFEKAPDDPAPDMPAPQRQFRSPADDPVFQFVGEAMGIEGVDKPPPADYDRVLPLKLSGPTMYDFVESMMNHPTKYGEVQWEAPNKERDREPYAKFPPDRRNPPPEFVEAHTRFIYVWGLPPLVLDGSPVDLDDTMQCVEVQKMIGECFDVSFEQVFLASPTSAFVGFPNIDDQKFAVAVGPMIPAISSPVVTSKYSGEAVLPHAESQSLVLLENLPLGLTASLLSKSLFGSSELGEVYGDVDQSRILMLSSNSAVIAMESAKEAETFVGSALVQKSLEDIGQHPIRYSAARRELISTGAHDGPGGFEPLRKLGPRLIVDGDMPTKSFFTSHASTLFLRNLDPSVTKEDIAEFFQPFCAVPRDVDGSTEIVTCRGGMPTGRAFVGFDEAGEAEAALEALAEGNGQLVGLGSDIVIADFVKERGQKTIGRKRPSRSEEELMDSLNNWQQYVDPADLQELLDKNISIEALDETFRAIRYHNTTFASMDQARRDETTNPDKDDGGMFKELVQTYVATLRECLSSPENPGPIYESIHFPDEPLDTEIFEKEPSRQEELQKRREIP